MSVRRSGPQLVLQDAAGKLLWTATLSRERVSIQAGEAGSRHYQVEVAGEGGYRASADDQPLGSVRWDEASRDVNVHNVAGEVLYRQRQTRPSLLWGLLLMTDIPEAHRYIMMAEIGARGR